MGQAITLTRGTPARPNEADKISYEEFLKLYEGQYAEWVGGRVQMGMSVSEQHADDSGFLESVLRFYVDARDLGKVYSAPFQMRLANQERGREPDIMFVATSNLGRLTPQYLDGPSDLAVEILSPESVGRDRGEKFVEYEAAGVREYWLIDPERKQAEFYILDENEQYQLVLSGKNGIFRSRVVEGFYLRIEWLWQEPLPKVPDILRELGVL